MIRFSRVLFVGSVFTVALLPLAGETTSPSAPGSASPAPLPRETVVLTVDGTNYTAAELDNIIAAIVPPGTPITASVRRGVAGMIVETRLLADEAVRRGLDQDPHVQTRLKFAHDQALGQAVAFQNAENLLNHEALEYYKSHQDGFEQIRVRHILIRTPDSPVSAPPGKPVLTAEEAKAKVEELRQRLLKGEDFAKLAAAESYDPSASRGGELLPFRRMQMAPEFENGAFATKVGEISAPVKSLFGYHLIQILERGVAPFDSVKVDIARLMERPNFEKFLQNLKQSHPATFNDSYFGPADEPASSAPDTLLRRR